MHYYVYILFSLKDKKLYIDFTENLKSRLSKHAKGEVTATKFRRPLRLIHYQYFTNKIEAKKQEVFLKSGFGRKQLKDALRKTLQQLGYINLD